MSAGAPEAAAATGEAGVSLLRRQRVATLTLERPPLNVLDLATLAALGRAMESLADDAGLQVLVVRGAGEKAFSAGVSVQDHTPERVAEMLERFHGALAALRELPAVTLAAVRGHCLGGGMELAAACDLVLAEEGARFGQPEVKLGCFPPFAAALLPARLGPGRTLELLATGRTLDAGEALRLGLVTHLAPAGELEARLEEVLAGLTAASTPVLRLIKRAVAAGAELGFPQALAETERLYTQELTATEDMEEGLRAFLEKRPPRWKHR